MLRNFAKGMGAIGEDLPELSKAFVNLTSASFTEGELSEKVKELIAVALGVALRCEYCIAYHVKKALEKGATREEILEAAGVAVAFGGTPAMVQTAVTVNNFLDEFGA